MLSKLMSVFGAFFMALGGVYVGRHIEGDMSFYAFIAFAAGVVWISQAPAIALRKRIHELELKLSSRSSADNV